MRFEISETINGCDTQNALSLLEAQLRKVSGKVVRNGQTVTANSIEASFGSINRSSTAVCSVRGNGSRGILTADVEYRPSFAFWIFFIIGLFTMLGWLVPLAFYMMQKGTVRSAIENVFRRVKAECEFNTRTSPPFQKTSSGDKTQGSQQCADEFTPDNLTKKCPLCAEIIKLEALVCRFCGNKFDPSEVQAGIQEAKSEFEARLKATDQGLDDFEKERQVATAGTRHPWTRNAATVVGIVSLVVTLALGGLWLREERKEVREQAAAAQVASPVAVPPMTAATGEPSSSAEAAGDIPPSETPSAEQSTASNTAAAALPVAAMSKTETGEAAPVEVSVSATQRAWISVRSDGKTVESLTLDPDRPELRSRSYTAQEKLVLVVGNPANVTVTYNGKPTGSLGQEGHRETITFTPQGMEKQ